MRGLILAAVSMSLKDLSNVLADSLVEVVRASRELKDRQGVGSAAGSSKDPILKPGLTFLFSSAKLPTT